MQSFITLVNENQLNKFEQRQVYDSIRNDYQILIQNYNQIKNSNSDNLVQEQIEMDVYVLFIICYYSFLMSLTFFFILAI